MDKIISIWNDGERWQAYSKELNIGVVESSEKQALLQFFRFFVDDYLVYKYTPQEKMSKGAKKLLKAYRKFIDEKSDNKEGK